MSIDQVSDEIFANIVNHDVIPLQHRMRLCAVAKKWRYVIREGFEKQTQLGLTTNRNAVRATTDMLVPEYKFTGPFLRRIGRLFPQVSELKLEYTSKDTYSAMFELFKIYQRKLKSLTVVGYQHQAKGNNPWKPMTPVGVTIRLANSLETLHRLTSLKLSTLRLSDSLVESLAPILARLERFSLQNCLLDSDNIIPALTHRCTHLEIPMECLNPWEDFGLDATLKQLTVTEANAGILKIISEEFSTLTNLKLHFTPEMIYFDTTMLTYLASLTELTTLQLIRLNISTRRINFATDLRQHSVESLHLQLGNRDGIDMLDFCMKLATWFPNLLKLTLECFDTCYEECADPLKLGAELYLSDVVVQVERIVPRYRRLSL